MTTMTYTEPRGAAPTGGVPDAEFDIRVPTVDDLTVEPPRRRRQHIPPIAATILFGAAALFVWIDADRPAVCFAGLGAIWMVIGSLESGIRAGLQDGQRLTAEKAIEAAKTEASRVADAQLQAARDAEAVEAERLAAEAARKSELAAANAARLGAEQDAQRVRQELIRAVADAQMLAREAAVEARHAAELAAAARIAAAIAPPTPKPIAGQSTATRAGEGFLYVILFSTGAIKVGQTIEPRTRLNKHRRDAEVYNVAIVDYWISPQHSNFIANEQVLLRICRRAGVGVTPVKKEYFHGMDFATALQFAASLHYRVAPIGGQS